MTQNTLFMTPALARTRRLARGLSLREVARRMHLSAPYISDLERGQRPWSAGLLARYVSALDRVDGAVACATAQEDGR